MKRKIVIEIDEEIYNHMKERFMYGYADTELDKVGLAVRNGTPLPKGHGDLKDFQKMYADITEKEELARQRVIDTPSNSPCYMAYMAQLNERTAFKEMLFDALTIIEADKGE